MILAFYKAQMNHIFEVILEVFHKTHKTRFRYLASVPMKDWKTQDINLDFPNDRSLIATPLTLRSGKDLNNSINKNKTSSRTRTHHIPCLPPASTQCLVQNEYSGLLSLSSY